MATGKRFFWLKLRREFMLGDEIDALMSQKNGSDYVVLYQMICLMTINTNGRFANKVGEMIVRFDPEKISRDCKWFDIDTVLVALELYKRLGLVYVEKDGVLAVADFNEIVGSETDWARQKKNQRLGDGGVDNVHLLSTPMSTSMSTQEIRDKSIELRVQSLDSSISLSTPAHACEEKDVEELEELDPDATEEEKAAFAAYRKEQVKRKFLDGSMGQGLVFISDEQFETLCELLSLEELKHYMAVMVDCESRGHKFGKTHFQAVLDMAMEDRRVGK